MRRPLDPGRSEAVPDPTYKQRVGTFLPGAHSSRATGDILMDLQKLTLEEIVALLRELADEIRAQAQPASTPR